MSNNPNIKQQYITRKSAISSCTRKQHLTKLLGRKSGVTIAQLQKSFGWQPHTARAAISRPRKDGLCIQRCNSEKGAVYRIAEGGGDHASR